MHTRNQKLYKIYLRYYSNLINCQLTCIEDSKFKIKLHKLNVYGLPDQIRFFRRLLIIVSDKKV